MLDADDVNELATQLRNRDPKAEVTRHHLNRKHGIQTVTKALELNHERYDRQQNKAVRFVASYSLSVPFKSLGAIPGRFKKRVHYA